MSGDAIDRLINLFERFPGIGPRQAERFVQFLLRSSPALRREFIEGVQALSKTVHQCLECFRYSSESGRICSICGNASRDKHLLAVVATDADLSALEKSGMYRGRYFVIGGVLHLGSEKENGLRIKELLKHVNDLRSRYPDFKEVILAFPANPEGDATAARLREELKNNQGETLIISSLGRGLSTGSELEYADPETLKNALAGRK